MSDEVLQSPGIAVHQEDSSEGGKTRKRCTLYVAENSELNPPKHLGEIGEEGCTLLSCTLLS